MYLSIQGLVKPGGTLGVAFGKDVEDLEKALAAAFFNCERVLVEKRIPGREITVAVLDRPEPTALPVIEIRTPQGTWYDFQHRYTAGLSEHVLPAPLPPEQDRRTQEVAVRAYGALGCRDFSRVDFVVPERGEPILLEINTLPGMTPTSLFPDAARAVGLSFEDLVAHLVGLALARGRGRS